MTTTTEEAKSNYASFMTTTTGDVFSADDGFIFASTIVASQI